MPASQPPKVGQAMNGYRFLGGDPSAATSWEPLHGEDYLKSLPQEAAHLVPLIKKYSDGDMPVPTAAALRNPQVMQLIEMATQFDPSFSAADYPSRAATRKDFTSGNAARNITSFNTVIQHLGKMAEDAAALNNSRFTPVNSLANAVQPLFGDARKSNFLTDKNAVVSELVRAFRGTGGTGADIEDWAKSFDVDGSPEQLSGSIQRGVELLRGRIEALGDQYNRGMKRTHDPVALLSPGAQEVFKQLEANPLGVKLKHDAKAPGDAQQQAQPAKPKPRPVMGGPTSLPQKGAGAPAGVDPGLWQHLTPEERKLWQN